MKARKTLALVLVLLFIASIICIIFSASADNFTVKLLKPTRKEQHSIYYGYYYYVDVGFEIEGGKPPYNRSCTLYHNGTKVNGLWEGSDKTSYYITDSNIKDEGIYTIQLTVTDADGKEVTVLSDGHIRVSANGSYTIWDSCPQCKSPNSIKDIAVEATCTESGLTEGYHCIDCGAVIIAQNVIPLSFPISCTINSLP